MKYVKTYELFGVHTEDLEDIEDILRDLEDEGLRVDVNKFDGINVYITNKEEHQSNTTQFPSPVPIKYSIIKPNIEHLLSFMFDAGYLPASIYNIVDLKPKFFKYSELLDDTMIGRLEIRFVKLDPENMLKESNVFDVEDVEERFLDLEDDFEVNIRITSDYPINFGSDNKIHGDDIGEYYVMGEDVDMIDVGIKSKNGGKRNKGRFLFSDIKDLIQTANDMINNDTEYEFDCCYVHCEDGQYYYNDIDLVPNYISHLSLYYTKEDQWSH